MLIWRHYITALLCGAVVLLIAMPPVLQALQRCTGAWSAALLAAVLVAAIVFLVVSAEYNDHDD